ncbi:hypothetical protein N7474_001745 [Penicillium riverlandense]|uniref:uncharacterized protein n=1 Tax=Penicillium riverlandense TaxID=1903569 RepID=UPI0025486D21|nr:uncharacterized protein N7474_001745 [Penicillium riverlandense]KAJ5833434.1 hypothetical protein N7474_001745 [Penicillium riverlandense]
MEDISEFMRPLPDPNDHATMYVRWMLDNPARNNGLELHVGTEDIAWKNLAADFTIVTGTSAIYKDVTLAEYFQLGIWPDQDVILGYSAGYDNGSFMTVRENYSEIWNTRKDNLTKRDYQLLDEILPTRVKSVKE